MFCDMAEINVGGEQRQLVTNAKMRKQCIDRTRLDSARTTQISQFRSSNVIFPVGIQERKCGKAFDDLPFVLGTRESLQEFLQDQPRAQNPIARFEGLNERVHLRDIGRSVTTQQQRPDAGVNEKIQVRS